MTAILISCSGSEGSRKDLLNLIGELEEKSMKNVDKFDTAMAMALVKNYDKFASEFEEDELSPVYLFKAGEMSMALHKPALSISYYNKIISDYPDFDKVPYCMFLKGFVYDEQLKDYDNARKAYEAFIEKYPNHDMTEAARFSIRNLGKSPEDLIEEFKKNSDTTQVGS